MKIYKRELCAEIWMQSEANVDEEKSEPIWREHLQRGFLHSAGVNQ